jgi:hypothetical protein
MTTLVGRDAELARLRALLGEAAAGRAVAAGEGFTVLCGQCAEIGDSVPDPPADVRRRPRPADRARYSSSRRIQDLRVSQHLIADHAVQPVFRHQVHPMAEEALQILLQVEVRASLGRPGKVYAART